MNKQLVQQLIDAITALINTDANDKAALDQAKAVIAQLQQTQADLNDPALVDSVNKAIAAAAAATPPSSAQPAPNPTPDQPAPAPAPANP